MTEHELEARQESEHDLDAQQPHYLELCACSHTAAAHQEIVRRGASVTPCALCGCRDFVLDNITAHV